MALHICGRHGRSRRSLVGSGVGLLDGHTANRNTKSISSAISSQQISVKNSKSKQSCHEKFLKKSIVRSRLKTVVPATYV